MDDEEARRRFAAAPVARLATVRNDGSPHLVPVAFALAGDRVYTAVDRKPKRHQRLQRLVNLHHDPRCSLLVDRYDDDWARLWWVRADGEATILDDPGPSHPALPLLADRYPQYRAAPPDGPLIIVTITGWAAWSASV